MKILFLHILDWLYSKNAQFGVDHIVIGQKTYWLDTDEDRTELFNLYNSEM